MPEGGPIQTVVIIHGETDEGLAVMAAEAATNAGKEVVGPVYMDPETGRP